MPPTSARASAAEPSAQRTIGLFGATGIGVGAIVGGGVLVLAGAAFQATGPSAVLAFALNGLLAVITALSFAEMSTAFPESGGVYTFAKKVLSARAAFAVGWLLWFAYIVAGVLYALGFAEYAVVVLCLPWEATGSAPPAWLGGHASLLALALLATTVYTIALIRSAGGGGEVATWGKVVLFAVLILAGVWGVVSETGSTLQGGLTPFFAGGASGMLSAMGITFIALQGFDLIAAVAGEVRDPRRVIPRAMLFSLALALAVYLPLLIVVSTAGVPSGSSIGELASDGPSTVIAVAVRHYMGEVGYWLVVVAAVLATLSALRANMLAASRVALTMARDRNLPPILETIHGTRGTPIVAVYATALALATILLMVPDLPSAGAAASLIFLLVFALAHWTAYLARRRSEPSTAAHPPRGFHAPLFPLLPLVGGVACLAMSAFQALTVPAAGGIVVVWLGLGTLLYFSIFASRSAAIDAFVEGVDPEMMRLRGNSPFVLVPVANPERAAGLVGIASAMAPRAVGRVLLLSVIRRSVRYAPDAAPVSLISSTSTAADEARESIDRAQRVVQQALLASMSLGYEPECLIRIGASPWSEILAVARRSQCTGVVLGLSDDASQLNRENLEELLNSVDCDVVFVKAPTDFRMRGARRILVPIGGRGAQHELRARLLGSLGRSVAQQEITLLTVLPTAASAAAEATSRKRLARACADNTRGRAITKLVRSDDSVAAIAQEALECDVVIVGLSRNGEGRRAFGDFALDLATRAPCAVILLSQRW